MKIIPLFLVTGLTLVAVLVTIDIFIQQVNAQKIGDVATPISINVAIPGMDKIQRNQLYQERHF